MLVLRPLKPAPMFRRHNFNFGELSMYEEDGLHPIGPGSHIYADMFIYYFQTLAKRVRTQLIHQILVLYHGKIL